MAAIPARVQSDFDLKIDKSRIPGAGRGLFIGKPIKEGDLIFAIDRPTLTVNAADHGTWVTCDNCFDTVLESNGKLYHTHPSKKKKKKKYACTRCYVYYYCNKLKKNEPKKEDIVVDGELRGMLRLLLLRLNHQIDDNEWNNLQTLHVATRLQPKAEGIALAVRIYTGTEMGEIELKDLFYKMTVNRLDMMMPFLKRYWDPTACTMFSAGYSIDSFAAMMNHSCKANAHWLFSGHQMRVVAVQDIAVREEVTITYSGEMFSPEKRKEELMSWWSINCDCGQCAVGAPSLQGSLPGRTQKLIGKLRKRKSLDFTELEGVIENHYLSYDGSASTSVERIYEEGKCCPGIKNGANNNVSHRTLSFAAPTSFSESRDFMDISLNREHAASCSLHFYERYLEDSRKAFGNDSAPAQEAKVLRDAFLDAATKRVEGDPETKKAQKKAEIELENLLEWAGIKNKRASL
ncbi:hypothetical protein B0O99DRAFT_737254 [Bisporella sp. PMI_857]|nr:hypothetical protein B0O99DRAFT_737808 [Bisporella sp. PMI_857]KAH8600472.1 hypothetical protein B0O99DRAFT_737254 [Bisporella sp. PMI_857]